MDYAELKVGTVVEYKDKKYVAVPNLPSYSKGKDFIYNPVAVAYSLEDGSKIGSTSISKAEISKHQLSKEQSNNFFVKLKMMGLIDVIPEVGKGYDSISNVSILRGNKAILPQGFEVTNDLFTMFINYKGKTYEAKVKELETCYYIIRYAEHELESDLIKGQEIELKKIKLITDIKAIKVSEDRMSHLLHYYSHKFNKLSQEKKLTEGKYAYYGLCCLPPEKIRPVFTSVLAQEFKIETRYDYYYNDEKIYSYEKKLSSTKEMNLRKLLVYELSAKYYTGEDIVDRINKDFPDVYLPCLNTPALINNAIKHTLTT